MSLHSYLRWLRGNWIWVTVFTLIGLIIAMGLSMMHKPKFVATSEIFLSTPRFGNVSLPADSPFLADGFSQQRARTYIQLATRVDLARRVVDRLGIGLRPEDLAAATSAWTPPDTVLIDISVKSDSPVEAKVLADAVTAELAADIRLLESRSGQVIPVVEPIVTRPAEAPSHPGEPRLAIYLLLGGFMGFLGGVTSAATLRRGGIDIAEVERSTGSPLLGTVVVDAADKSGRSGAVGIRGPRTRWQWNDVLMRVAVELDRRDDQVLAVTGGNAPVDNSAVAAGLAAACANAGTRVVLLLLHPDGSTDDGADRRAGNASTRKARHQTSDGHFVGLADIVVGGLELRDVLQPSDNQNLYRLYGPELDNVAPLVRSQKFQALIVNLRESFDLVILDSPEFIQLAQCTPVSKVVDSVVLVIPEGGGGNNLSSTVRLVNDEGMRLLGSIAVGQASPLTHMKTRTAPLLVTTHEGFDQ